MVAAMVAGGGARSSGGRTPAGRRAGLGFKDGRPLLRDVPARQDADRGSSAIRRRGQGGQCPACARIREQHAAGADSRGAPECVLASRRRYA
jgi:hypothetical protein